MPEWKRPQVQEVLPASVERTRRAPLGNRSTSSRIDWRQTSSNICPAPNSREWPLDDQKAANGLAIVMWHRHHAIVRMKINSAIFHFRPSIVIASSQTHFNRATTAAAGGRLDDLQGRNKTATKGQSKQ